MNPLRLRDLCPSLAMRDFADLSIAGVCIDSRQAKTGDLFIALPGTRSDGVEFISDAQQRGAVAALVQGRSRIASTLPVIEVNDIRQTAGELCDAFFAHPSAQLSLIGITGTNGKTTVSWLLAQLLSQLGQRSAALGTLGSGFPDELLQTKRAVDAAVLTTADVVMNHRALACLVNRGARFAAMEVSSHALDQQRVAGLRFATAVFTNLTRDHLDYHGSMERYAAAKAQLFDWPGLVGRVINLDDATGARLFAQYQRLGVERCLGYSLHVQDGALSCRRAEYNANGIRADLSSPWGDLSLHSPLLGSFNLANLMAVIGVALQMGFATVDVESAVANIQGAPGRMQRFGLASGATVIVDYAHTPDGLTKALQVLRDLCRGRLICVFGCGGERDRGKRPLMAAAAEQLADQVWLTDDNPRGEPGDQIAAEVLAGAQRKDRWQLERDRRKAIAAALSSANANDVVLVAGKGHENYQEISGRRLPFSDLNEVIALGGSNTP